MAEPMTDEEYQAAQAALAAETARRNAEESAEAAAAYAAEYERRAPLRAIAGSDAVATLTADIAALGSELRFDDKVGPAIKAIQVGIAALARELAAAVPATVAGAVASGEPAAA